jgi:hypothetical protein
VSEWVVDFRASPYDVYVGRPSPFGNPFVPGRDGSRDEVIAKFEAWILAQPEKVVLVKRFLKGKVLGCYCAPRACHADVLARIANEEP